MVRWHLKRDTAGRKPLRGKPSASFIDAASKLEQMKEQHTSNMNRLRAMLDRHDPGDRDGERIQAVATAHG